ncbi:MAG: SMI1/KNR4 family protein, partial [Cyclobacteriaceae bacterium]
FLKKLISDNNDQIVNFYKTANGLKLYCNGDTSGIEIYPIDQLSELNEEWKESFSDFEEDELYDFQKNGVAFGAISQSGNYFVLLDGKVYYSDHDGGDDTILGEDFNEFLDKTVTEPADFLYEMGCYTRYSDGKTAGQWIPKEFSADEV